MAGLIPAKRMSERRCRASSARSGALSRSGWPATTKTASHRGSDTPQSTRPLRPRVCHQMEALNPGTGHVDAVQRCPPPLRTTQNAGLIPALCERHDDTSSADRYWLTVLTEPDRGRSDTPRTTLMAKPLITPGAARHARPHPTTPLPCPAAALEANDLGAVECLSIPVRGLHGKAEFLSGAADSICSMKKIKGTHRRGTSALADEPHPTVDRL